MVDGTHRATPQSILTPRTLFYARRARRSIVAAISVAVVAAGAADAAAAPAATVVSGPGYWTAETSATFGLTLSEPASVECRLDRHRDASADWEPCLDGHTIVGPLAEGRHVLEARAVGATEAQDSWTWRVDVTAPTVPTVFEPDELWALDRRVSVSWGAFDSYSGVGAYSVGYHRWTAAGAVRTNVPWLTSTTATGATFPAQPGSTYCVRATATDRAKNPSPAWSPRRCFALPLDDQALLRRGKWASRANAPDYFLGTYIQSKQTGASARRKVVARRLVLIATRCPTCGSVTVRWRGNVLKTIDLVAPELRPSEVIPIVSFERRFEGTVRLDVVSAGKTVRIEGLGVSAV
jgi:hypothetical protein